MTQQTTEITLKLSVEQINVVIAGLDELPHKFSRPLIDTISKQAQEQMQAASNPQGLLAGQPPRPEGRGLE